MLRCNRGQFSWAWVFIVATIGLATTTMLYIILNQAVALSDTNALAAGLDPERQTIINSIWTFAPIILLFSWAAFLVMVAAATRGGDTI